MKNWDPIRAMRWMRKAARDLGSDFMDMPFEFGNGGLGEALRASAGALYYAADTGVGLESPEEFFRYLHDQVGWQSGEAYEAFMEIWGCGCAPRAIVRRCDECNKWFCYRCDGSMNNGLCTSCWRPHQINP